MKFTPISKAFFGVPEEDESFDLDAATRIFKWYMSDDTAEQIMVNTLAAEVPRLLEYHAPEISKAFQRQYEERKEIIKRMIINGAISKSMSDDTIEEISKAVDLIEKAAADYTIWDRQDNARKQWRDKGGRFRQMGVLNIAPPHEGQKPVPDEVLGARTANGHNPHPTKGFNRDTAMRYQNSYAQISAALENNNYNELLAVQTWKNADDSEEVRRTVGNKPEDMIKPSDFKGSSLKDVTFYVIDDEAARPDVFDAARAMGASRGFANEASYQFGNGLGSPDTVRDFGTDWNKASVWDESGATRGMKRLGAASNFANQIFGNVDDPRIQAAIKAGQWAGQYGPEAEKVIGPHARKSAYRYRGVERKPDSRLNNAFRSAISTATTPTDARTRIIYPRITQHVAGRDRTIAVPVESPVINYMRSILPNEDLLRLHTNSGAIAPSQGVIIDRKGALATQAVGYGDDHYLPFNLKNLKALKGGEYIRTRTLGGPTTEDVYTGMASGARAFTVVSHSGVYTVEFADDFRGGRRFNDKSARMVKRYGMLLDSLEAEQTTLSAVPADRQTELMVKATGRYPGDDDNSRKSRSDYFDRLVKEEQQDPKPSNERKEEWAGEFLDQHAQKYDDGKGTELEWKNVRAQALVRAARDSGEDPDQVARQFATNQSTIVAIGEGEAYKNFLKTKEREYVATQKPLRLNSEGYYLALQALQEQFPYYIQNVEYRPWEKTSRQKDAGYVKPRFNRPAAVKTGYWDTSIEGHIGDVEATNRKTGVKEKTGKVSADRTNYQNLAARRPEKPVAPEEGTEKPKTPGSPEDNIGALGAANGGVSLLTKAKYRAELGAALNAADLRVRATAKDKALPISDSDRAKFASEVYPDLMGMTPDELKRRYVAEPDFAKRVDEQAAKALADERLDLPQELKDKFDSGGRVPTVSYTPEKGLTDNKAWFSFGDDADLTLGGGDDITAENIQTFVDNDPQLIEATTYTGVNDLSTGKLSEIDMARSLLMDKKGELDGMITRGDFARPVHYIDVAGDKYTDPVEAQTKIDGLIKGVAKLRQAKRRYDEAMRSGNLPQNAIKVIGYTGQPVTSGSTGGMAAPTSFNKDDTDWAASNGIILKKLTPIRKAYLRRV